MCDFCWYGFRALIAIDSKTAFLYIELNQLKKWDDLFDGAGLVLDPVKRAFSGAGRGRLVVQANRKKGLGATLFGTRRKRARVSGFRSRMATVGGRKVLKARRKKGRKNLCPGCRPVRK